MASAWGQAHIMNMASLDMGKYCKLDSVEESISRKCKIICTMGPNQSSKEAIIDLINSGMNVARMNFSHGDHESHGAMVARIREACKECGKHVAIALDTKGPEIRTGFFKEGGKIQLKKGQDLKLVVDYDFKGDSTCFALSYPKLCTSVKPGNIILCADGSLSLKVKTVGSDHVISEVMNDCSLGERKNCNLPGIQVDLPVLQEKDIKDLVEFGIPQGVDMVFASFVQSAADVEFIRKTLGVRGRQIHIVPKIENEAGVNNFDEIVKISDGIMVARGDLGMEIPPENVFVAQKMMITKCNLAGKPVITATQMLESMCGAPRPTRAEASDVANAVLDGTDCVMLSGETAAGGYPLDACTIMRKICQTTEEILDYGSLYLNTRLQVMAKGPMSPVEGVCSSAVKAAIDCEAKLIVALTETGATAVILAKYRPKAQILAITASETTQRHLHISRGVVPMLTASFVGTDSVIAKALKQAKEWGMVTTGDCVVAVHGTKEECPGSSTLMKMIVVP